MPSCNTPKLRTACICGASDFYINEGITHKADTSHEGKLIVYRRDWVNEIESVVCATCDHYYQAEDFDDA